MTITDMDLRTLQRRWMIFEVSVSNVVACGA